MGDAPSRNPARGLLFFAAAALAAAGQLPPRFEPNLGQTDPRVRFLARGAGYGLFLTEREAVLKLPHSQTVRMSWSGANPRPRLEGDGLQPGVSHYLQGAAAIREVPNFSRVRYRDLYPGVDLLYYGSGRMLEYDFVVAPGADPSRIRMSFSGASAALDAEGRLNLSTGSGSVVHNAPLVYQESAGRRRTIPARFRKTGPAEFAFELGPYDRSQTLVIDPTLVYTTYAGGTGEDAAAAIAVDAAGSAYVTGRTRSVDFPGAAGRSSAIGGADVFISKLNPAGTAFLWTTYFGGSSEDVPVAIALDAAGNIHVAGNTTSDNLPVTRNVYQRNRRSTGHRTNGFLVKLNPEGSGILWCTYFGADDDEITAMVLDASGSVFVTGQTRSVNFPTTPGAFQTAGFQRAFVTKFSPDAQDLAFSTYLGGSQGPGGLNDDRGLAIALDSTGAVYVTGATTASDFPVTPGAFQRMPAGTDPDKPSVFVTKMAADGASLIWSTYLGGRGGDEPRGIAVNSRREVFIAGVTRGDGYPTTTNAYRRGIAASDPADIFITRLESDATRLLYSTLFGGTDLDELTAMTVDSFGNVYLCGYTLSLATYPLTLPNFQPTPGGGQEAFVTSFNTEEGLQFSSFLGGLASDSARALALDTRGNLYVAGTTVSPDFPVQRQSAQFAYGGIQDAFVAKIATQYLPENPVVSGAGFVRGPVAPGQIVSIFGSGFGPPVALGTQINEDGLVATTLGETEVTFEGFPAPLFFVRDDQINAQVPYEVSGRRTATLRVRYRGQAGRERVVQIVPAAPSIVTIDGDITRAVVLNQDGTVNSASNPARAGDVVVFFATGEGDTRPNGVTGRPAAAPLPVPAAPVVVRIGGAVAQTRYAGAAPGFVGLMQVNAVVPPVPAGRVPVVLTIGDRSSPVSVGMFVR
ncbi:MAG: SBBP repeat-containing protein [Bryobacteraceae bacterium]|nr:SBBP repeat-containing protein [Bryobacteraceae bacterium]